jgi:hypothetical protein
MKKLSSMAKPSFYGIALVSGGILATVVSLTTMTSPATAQTTAPATNRGTDNTTTTYERRNDDNSGLWGLAGLVGLLGFLGRGKEEDRRINRRDDTPVYRDPNVR